MTSTGWGTRTKADDPKFAPHTNVFIRGNHISHPNTEYGCNGMYITNVRHAVIERNVVNRTGTSGIETYFADDVTIQFNEVSETKQRAGGADSNGIDRTRAPPSRSSSTTTPTTTVTASCCASSSSATSWCATT